jgi:3-oxoacyl-[acyl-carrier protein] reductase
VAVAAVAADFRDPEAAPAVIAQALARYGRVDIVVACHAHSSPDGLEALSADSIDEHLQVNVRGSLLLARELAGHHDGSPGGRLVLFTSGQYLGPMPEEIAYAASKAALAGITPSLADAVADLGITVNCVNPGPTDTGYATPEVSAQVARRFPAGRWGSPDDAARLVAWLCSDDGAWVTGQVIGSEGGFRR